MPQLTPWREQKSGAVQKRQASQLVACRSAQHPQPGDAKTLPALFAGAPFVLLRLLLLFGWQRVHPAQRCAGSPQVCELHHASQCVPLATAAHTAQLLHRSSQVCALHQLACGGTSTSTHNVSSNRGSSTAVRRDIFELNSGVRMRIRS